MNTIFESGIVYTPWIPMCIIEYKLPPNFKLKKMSEAEKEDRRECEKQREIEIKRYNFGQEFVGQEVIYTSQSGRKYKAFVTKIYSDCLRVALEFRDMRNKLVPRDYVRPNLPFERTEAYSLKEVNLQ